MNPTAKSRRTGKQGPASRTGIKASSRLERTHERRNSRKVTSTTTHHRIGVGGGGEVNIPGTGPAMVPLANHRHRTGLASALDRESESRHREPYHAISRYRGPDRPGLETGKSLLLAGCTNSMTASMTPTPRGSHASRQSGNGVSSSPRGPDGSSPDSAPFFFSASGVFVERTERGKPSMDTLNAITLEDG